MVNHLPPAPTQPGGFHFSDMLKRLRTTSGLFVVFIITLTTMSAAAEAVNQYCPVTPNEPAESYITTEYNGQTIGFCCKRCLRKFNANPEAYLVNIQLENADAQNVNDASGSAHEKNHDHSETAGQDQPNQHDHSIDHVHSNESPVLIFLGKLHVLSVHLPIALLPIATILEILGIALRSQAIKFVARTNFLLGALSAIVAATLGWVAASQSHYSGDLTNILAWHRSLGVSVASISLVGLLGMLAMRKSETWGVFIYRSAIFVLLVLVPVAAHFGGSLIYGMDYPF